MKKIFFITILLLFGKVVFAQSSIDKAYRNFQSIDWTKWNQLDTINCLSDRISYGQYFDTLLIKGISKDTVEKYMGQGIHFKYVDKVNGKIDKDYAKIESYVYFLRYDCKYKMWVSRITINYDKNKVNKFNRKVTYID